LLDLMKEVLHH